MPTSSQDGQSSLQLRRSEMLKDPPQAPCFASMICTATAPEAGLTLGGSGLTTVILPIEFGPEPSRETP